MARIGLSYWGFCEDFDSCNIANTPDGHRYGRRLLVDTLVSRGHEVFALQQRREPVPYKNLTYSEGLPDLDVVFLEWRWPIYKNSGPDKFEPDLDRQKELLNHYCGNTPVIAWDTDLKMTTEDEKTWPEMVVADPTFNPKNEFLCRERLTFWSDFKPLFPAAVQPLEFGYIGNNYERDEMFMRYYSQASRLLRENGVQTTVHGNWLQRSPERVQPELLVTLHPFVSFAPRLGFRESMERLNSFVATVHITKPRYARQGFASPRYLENIITNTPALVPSEFAKNDILGKYWTVASGFDVNKRVLELRSMTSSEREEIVAEQRDNLLRYHDFSVDHVCEFIENQA